MFLIEMNNMQFVRSKKVFLISECLLNQNIRAYGVGNTKGEGAVSEIVDLLTKNGCGFTVVPCPEILYEGLKRKACDRECYENQKYRSLCQKLAENFVQRYKLYLDDCYQVGGFICVNGSPSCAIDYCYKEKQKCFVPGIFIEEIKNKLKEQELSLRFIGVRLKEIDAALSEISNIINTLNHKD